LIVQVHRFERVSRRKNFETGALQNVHRCFPHERLIFNQENGAPGALLAAARITLNCHKHQPVE